MTRFAILAVSLMALAGCGEEPTPSNGATVAAENDNRAEAVAENADPNAFVAGKWETKQTIASADGGAAVTQCLPAEAVKRPDANFFAGSDASECKYDRYSMTDGKLSAAMTCNASAGSLRMTLEGHYTPTTYALTAHATPTGGQSTSARLEGTWLGACEG